MDLAPSRREDQVLVKLWGRDAQRRVEIPDVDGLHESDQDLQAVSVRARTLAERPKTAQLAELARGRLLRPLPTDAGVRQFEVDPGDQVSNRGSGIRRGGVADAPSEGGRAATLTRCVR